MIAEIVSNGMLALPSSLAVVGLVPGLVLIVFLGSFALFTSWLLVKFKLRHPEGEDEVLLIPYARSDCNANPVELRFGTLFQRKHRV